MEKYQRRNAVKKGRTEVIMEGNKNLIGESDCRI
jgi:hypothetical protein